jgi:hypothetical protein
MIYSALLMKPFFPLLFCWTLFFLNCRLACGLLDSFICFCCCSGRLWKARRCSSTTTTTTRMTTLPDGTKDFSASSKRNSLHNEECWTIKKLKCFQNIKIKTNFVSFIAAYFFKLGAGKGWGVWQNFQKTKLGNTKAQTELKKWLPMNLGKILGALPLD